MRPAATVVLVRDGEGGHAIEVLMMRRAERLSFIGGMWVFPGGRMDAADASAEALARILPSQRAACEERPGTIDGGGLEPDETVGFRVAACRETFEEAGVLLARDEQGRPCDPALVARLQSRRAEVVEDPARFVRMLAEENLFLDVAPLVYWSHWITPSVEPRRFDTRFYVVPLPAGQPASADLSELTEHAWSSPSSVAAAFERGEMRMVPPTLLTLEDLADSHARHGSLPSMLAAERNRATPPVMPRIVMTDAAVRVVMPWDPEYGALPGEGTQTPEPYPPHLASRRSSVTLSR